MGKNVPYFAGPDDHSALMGQIEAIGMVVVPPCPGLPDRGADDPSKGPCCLLSFLDPRELHPYGPSPQRVSEAVDPLLSFVRAYYAPPHLVAGCISWSDDSPELAKQTKPYFTRLRRWMDNNWRKRREDGYYVGPQADDLIADGAETLYFPPGTTIQEVPVRGGS